jgi:hypothetical protein
VEIGEFSFFLGSNNESFERHRLTRRAHLTKYRLMR